MNWSDDMELAAASLYKNTRDVKYQAASFAYAQIEKLTPWLGSDTAAHYQWYPFINAGHNELAKQFASTSRSTITGFYKQGIEKVWSKAQSNAFYLSLIHI